jgi:hypothetical protein
LRFYNVNLIIKRNNQNLNFEVQRKISNDINLSEQIKIFIDLIEFSSINLEISTNELTNDTKTKDKNVNELDEKLNEYLKGKFL